MAAKVMAAMVMAPKTGALLNGGATEARPGVFWMGPGTHPVPMSMHAGNRKRLVTKMLKRIQESGGSPRNSVVLLEGGVSETRYCTDHEPLFRQESYFSYLFGVKEPGFYGALDLATGKCFLFMPLLPKDYAVWMGTIHGPEHFKDMYEVDGVFYVEDMPEVLAEMGEGGERPTLYLLQGKNTDSGKMCKPASFKGIELFKTDLEHLHPVLSDCRVLKSEEELQLLRYVNSVSSAAHVEVMRRTKPGMMEYQLESMFQHHVYTNGGCRHCSYTCICATGHNSAVLHYGHAAAPNDRLLNDGDIALLDMGAEYHCYASDITCSFPVNGKFTPDQRMVYEGVLAAQRAVMNAMKPGVSWVHMHRLAERTILKALKDGGVLQGSVDEMMDQHLGATFMAHGLGHLMGLDTHDVGGYPEGTDRINEPGLRNLRTVRTLEEGMVLTVEPGIYFIDALLQQALEDDMKSKFLNVDAIEHLRGFGGVRLEDDVVVTADGIENLTCCPREVRDVEAVMAGAPWPPKV